MSTGHPSEYTAVRLAKAETLRKAGVNPYAVRTPERSQTVMLRAEFEAAEAAHQEAQVKHAGAHTPAATTEEAPAHPPVGIPGSAAGRVLGIRAMSKKAIFIDLWDESGRLQLYLNKGSLTETEWTIVENLDLGDFIWADGEIKRTKTGEISLFVSMLKFLTKALAVPPLEKSGGLTNVETRSRKRYADLLASPERREVFATRSRILSELRSFLASRGFMEVETPMMHPIPGGAKARPFITHHNTLDMDLYLRIAPELYLKRLLVGGFERVYEVNRNFRNEGIDFSHNPEFTMLELYQAYSDYHGIMDLTEAMFVHLAKMLRRNRENTTTMMLRGNDPAHPQQPLVFMWGNAAIDLTPPFKRAAYGDLFKHYTGVDMLDEAAVRERARKIENGAEIAKLPHWAIVDELFDECVQSNLLNPTFVIDYPTVICPLTKAREDNPAICERFELFINGMEFANAFSELNDPVEQRRRFEEQVARAIATKDEESPKEVDHDYVEALEFGMPPAGGLGVGIDRMVMLLTDTHSIRDVILFPHLRPETHGGAHIADASGRHTEQQSESKLHKSEFGSFGGRTLE